MRPVRLLRISHSWWFGEGFAGRGRTARNRVQGNTRLDRGGKPEGPGAKASDSGEHWRSEVDYGFIYRDREVVMNARNIEFAGRSQDVPSSIGVTAKGYCNAIRPPADVIDEHFSEELRECTRVREVFRGTVSTSWRQYDCNSRRRQQRLKEIQGCEWVLIFSWLGALLIWGFLWWAAIRLLCDVAQFVQYVPRLLK